MIATTATIAMIGGLGPWELAIILVIVLVLFGAGKLPQVFEAFGKGMKSFREAQRDDSIDVSPPKRLPHQDDDLDDAREVEHVRKKGA